MNEPSGNASPRIWAYIVAIAILFSFGTALSLLHDVHRIREERRTLAISQADIISRTIFATRRWAMETGVASVPAARMTEITPSDERKNRSQPEMDGVKNGKLAKVDHVSMIQFMEKMLGTEGFHVRITGRDALFSPSHPDIDWERTSLAKLVEGSKEEYALMGTAGNRVFRYMAPLKIDAGCIRCHEQKGFRIGDVQNAISISFPYAPFERSAREAERREIVEHLLSLGAALVCLFFLGNRIVALTRSVQETQRKVRTLEGILPMCMHCKRIRKEGAEATDQTGWVPVADYIRDRSEAEVSHGICPECLRKLYGPGGEG